MKFVKPLIVAITALTICISASARFTSSIMYTYYSDSSKTSQVGSYYVPCYGSSTGIQGTKTSFYTKTYPDKCSTLGFDDEK